MATIDPAWLMLAADLQAAAEAADATRPLLPMILIGIVLAVTFLFIAFEWLHKAVAAMVSAVVATGRRSCWG